MLRRYQTFEENVKISQLILQLGAKQRLEGEMIEIKYSIGTSSQVSTYGLKVLFPSELYFDFFLR